MKSKKSVEQQLKPQPPLDVGLDEWPTSRGLYLADVTTEERSCITAGAADERLHIIDNKRLTPLAADLSR